MGLANRAFSPALLTAVCASAAGTLTALVLIAEAFGLPPLTFGSPESIPMVMSTSVLALGCALLAGVEPFWPHGRLKDLVLVGIATTVATVAGVVLFRSLSGFTSAMQPGIVAPPRTAGGIPLGVMSPITASLFLTIALNIVALGGHKLRLLVRVARVTTLLSTAFCGTVILAYAAGAPLFYQGTIVPIALPTAIILATLHTAFAFRLGAYASLTDFFFGAHDAAVSQTPSGHERLIFVAATTAMVAVVAYITTWQVATEQVRHQRQLAAELATLADFKVHQLAERRELELRDVRMLMRAPNLVEALSRPAQVSTDATRLDALRTDLRLLRATMHYREIAVFDRNQRLICAEPEPIQTFEDLQQARAEALVTRDVVITDLHTHSANQLDLEVAAPVLASDQRAPIGTLTIRYDSDSLLGSILQSWPASELPGHTFLFRNEGSDWVYVSSQSGLGSRVARLPVEAGRGTFFTRVAQGKQTLIERATDPSGRPVVGLGQRIPATSWSLAVAVDRTIAFAPMRKTAMQVILAGAGGAWVILLAAGALWRQRRLETLRREATAAHERAAVTRRLALLMQHANDIILVLDEAGRILDANDRALTSYGYTLAELRALPAGGLRSPEAASYRQDDMKVIATDAGGQIETIHVRKDGNHFPVELHGRSFVVDQTRYIVAILRDISEQKAQREQIERWNRLYQALSHINHTTITARSRDELFNTICRGVVETAGFKLAWIGWRDPATQAVVPVATCGDTFGYTTRIRVFASDRPEGHGPTGRAVREGRAVVCNDLLAEPLTRPWHEQMRQSGLRASIALPVRVAGEVVGALTVYAAERDVFGPQEIALLEEAARDVSFALDYLAGEQQRHDGQAALLASERRFRAMIEGAPVAVGISRDGVTLYANLEYRRLFGFGADEDLTGQPMADRWAPAARPALTERIQLRTPDAPLPPRFEGPGLRKDGTIFPMELTTALIEMPDGTAIFAVVSDISARKRAERDLRDQAALLDKASEAIIATDREDRITYFSRGAERIFGWPTADAIGQKLGTLLVIGEWSQNEAAREALNGAADWRGDVHVRTRSGNPIIIEAGITLLRDASGERAGHLIVATDITEQKELEARFLRAQRLESLGMLASGIAHDFNNVLAPIRMAAPILQSHVTDPASQRMLLTLDACAERGAALVRQILSFAQGVTTEPQLTQLKHVLRDVFAVAAETFPKSIRLEENIPADLWLVMANPTQIHQVVLNLCVNARDAMPQGGALSLVAENWTLDPDAAAREGVPPGDWVLVRVSDTGTGIPAEILPKIWEAFFTTKEIGKGTGLGLSTVRSIIEAHHGLVTVATEPGRGTTFRILLPAAESRASHHPFVRPTATASGRGETILYVDDEASIRDAAQAVLQAAGYHVLQAQNGNAAAALFQETPAAFSLVITDCDMPDGDGLSLVRTMRAIAPDIRILSVSGLSHHPDDELSALADDFLAKPFSADALLTAVDQLLHSPK